MIYEVYTIVNYHKLIQTLFTKVNTPATAELLTAVQHHILLLHLIQHLKDIHG